MNSTQLIANRFEICNSEKDLLGHGGASARSRDLESTIQELLIELAD
jgi:hypothetical protein